MQGKGLVKFFFAALVLVCLYQLSFTWVANREGKKAENYAQSGIDPTLKDDARRIAIADRKSEYFAENSDKVVYNIGILKFNYDEVKKRALNLGLDLQGGMSVVLEVSKYDLLKQLSSDPKNEKFIAALEKAHDESLKGKSDIIELFSKYYIESNPGAQLVSLFSNSSNVDDLPRNSSNDAVVTWLKTAADDGVESTYTKLKERIDRFGVSSPIVTLQKSTGRIMVELPGVDNPKRARELLQSTANLQFWEVWINQDPEFGGAVNQANNILMAMEKNEDTTAFEETPILDTTKIIETPDLNSSETVDILGDSLGNDSLIAEDTVDIAEENAGPLANILLQSNDPAAIGTVAESDTLQLMKYLKMDEVLAQFPVDVLFMLSAKPIEGTKNYDVYAIKTVADSDEPPLDGSAIKSASPDRDPMSGRVQISMNMKPEGARKWKTITEKNIGRFIAISLDNKVYSAPRVNDAIGGGRSSISGNFTQEEAIDLSNILEVGKLPVPSKIVQEDIVGPSLGAESIRDGVISMVVGLLLVIIFMAFYYARAGIIADLALFANIFFIFGVLASIGATLTLPGIAGLVLTMGMAVDANVIIYERVREELAKGKSMVKAIADGYSNSYSAIIDSHVTTFIIGIILNEFGSGPIKGFAIVLMIGIVFSLFTAIFISRLILDWMAKTNKKITYFTSVTQGAFKNINLKFMQNRKWGYLFSGILTVISIIVILVSGFNYGVEFKGGRSYTVKFENAIDAETVRNQLSEKFDPAVQVKTFSSAEKLKITTTYMIASADPNADSLATLALYNNIKSFYPSNVDFKTWDANYKESQMKVEPTMAEDIKTKAVWAIAISLLATFLYIFVRFRRWQFGAGAVISLIHDGFMTLAVFALLKNALPFTLQIDETFIAAILTIIGYSIMDTVVVYDRIREFLRESKSGTLVEVFNIAINQTLSRTVITSGVTILSILAILFFGSDNIQGFAFAMVIGIAFGTYSSVFIASAIAIDLYKKEQHHKSAEVVMK